MITRANGSRFREDDTDAPDCDFWCSGGAVMICATCGAGACHDHGDAGGEDCFSCLETAEPAEIEPRHIYAAIVAAAFVVAVVVAALAGAVSLFNN